MTLDWVFRQVHRVDSWCARSSVPLTLAVPLVTLVLSLGGSACRSAGQAFSWGATLIPLGFGIAAMIVIRMSRERAVPAHTGVGPMALNRFVWEPALASSASIEVTEDRLMQFAGLAQEVFGGAVRDMTADRRYQTLAVWRAGCPGSLRFVLAPTVASMSGEQSEWIVPTSAGPREIVAALALLPLTRSAVHRYLHRTRPLDLGIPGDLTRQPDQIAAVLFQELIVRPEHRGYTHVVLALRVARAMYDTLRGDRQPPILAELINPRDEFASHLGFVTLTEVKRSGWHRIVVRSEEFPPHLLRPEWFRWLGPIVPRFVVESVLDRSRRAWLERVGS